MDNGTREITLSVISALSGIIIAYIVNVASKKVTATRQKMSGKDRMEQMFDGYERLIKQKDIEDDRKQRYIKLIEQELAATQKRVKMLETELEISRADSVKLREQLEAMREEYKNVKDK